MTAAELEDSSGTLHYILSIDVAECSVISCRRNALKVRKIIIQIYS